MGNCHQSCSDEGCGCNQGQSCCGQKKSCGCGSKSNESSCDMTSHLLCIADEAWKDVLKEKIKEIIRTDSRMDSIAKVIAEANKERWHNKMAKEKGCQNFKQQLQELFGAPCCKK